jgi:hypothetical protein
VLGAVILALSYRLDRSALITGGAIGGLCQGVVAILIFRRGYVFRDITTITGPLYLASLAVHLLSGLAVGALLFLAFRWARPRHSSE